MHTTAFVCIAAAMVLAVVYETRWTGLIMWPALVAMMPMAVALALAEALKTQLFGVVYLVVGTASVYWFSLTIASQIELVGITGAVTVAFPKIAMLLVGGTGARPSSGLLWCLGGFALAESASAIAIAQARGEYVFDETTFAAFVVVLFVLATTLVGQRGADRSQASLYTAAREELVAALRHKIEVRAAALLHDTVLNQLTAISASTSGELNPLLAEQIRQDLSLLASPVWLSDTEAADGAQEDSGWQSTAVYEAIMEASALGLDVDATGDLASLALLDVEPSRELGRAVKQCLVNVLAHSGTRVAEVAVHSSGTELLLMVVDSGRGFEPSSIGTDRFGLRHSVLGRIEAVGGSGQIWSTPGRGTSVVLRVPMPVSRTGVPALRSGS
ncbi:MAG: ATP-binding protein [Burkholderiaceae bacterium]|nr:ATP-binding protein [Microbacteriaceae bacterium]